MLYTIYKNRETYYIDMYIVEDTSVRGIGSYEISKERVMLYYYRKFNTYDKNIFVNPAKHLQTFPFKLTIQNAEKILNWLNTLDSEVHRVFTD